MRIKITLSFLLIFIGLGIFLETLRVTHEFWKYVKNYWPLLLVSIGFENLIGKKWAYVLGAVTLSFFGFLLALFLRKRFF